MKDLDTQRSNYPTFLFLKSNLVILGPSNLYINLRISLTISIKHAQIHIGIAPNWYINLGRTSLKYWLFQFMIMVYLSIHVRLLNFLSIFYCVKVLNNYVTFIPSIWYFWYYYKWYFYLKCISYLLQRLDLILVYWPVGQQPS